MEYIMFKMGRFGMTAIVRAPAKGDFVGFCVL